MSQNVCRANLIDFFNFSDFFCCFFSCTFQLIYFNFVCLQIILHAHTNSMDLISLINLIFRQQNCACFFLSLSHSLRWCSFSFLCSIASATLFYHSLTLSLSFVSFRLWDVHLNSVYDTSAIFPLSNANQINSVRNVLKIHTPHTLFMTTTTTNDDNENDDDIAMTVSYIIRYLSHSFA